LQRERVLSAQMSRRTEEPGVAGHQYTEKEIAAVKAMIEVNPALGRQLIDSAQSGNEADLEFILQSGLLISSDSPTESSILEKSGH